MTEAQTKLMQDAASNLGKALGASIYANWELQSPFFDYEAWKRANDESNKYGLTAFLQGGLLFLSGAFQPPRRSNRRQTTRRRR